MNALLWKYQVLLIWQVDVDDQIGSRPTWEFTAAPSESSAVAF